MLAGIALYFFRGSIASNIRYLLQIPPLGVAAYIFAFNLFRYYNGTLPENVAITTRDVLVATVISAGVFFLFTFLFVVIISFIDSLG